MSGASFGRIGPYELRGVLGRGGMATVYRAYSPALQREVALKVLTTQEHRLDPLRERFRREAQVVGRLDHPNILSLLDSGEEHGVPYLVMELIEGGALNTRLGRPLPPHEAISVARQIGAALDYAHARGIVHRDVKPANIFLSGQRAVLADFGIVKVFGESGPKLTQTGIGIGTPEYTAPEQAVGEALDGRSDLYALGIVLYEMLTGKPPYQGGTMEVISAHVQGALPDPRVRNPALPPAVSAVLIKALARQPQGRYESGAALADALEQAITGNRPGQQAAIDATNATLMLDRTREMLLQTQMQQIPPAPGIDATIIAQPANPLLPSRPTPPPPPAALPPVPSLPTTPPGSEGASTHQPQPNAGRTKPAPEPPRTLPPTPMTDNRPTVPPQPSAGPASTIYTPQHQQLPTQIAPTNQQLPTMAVPPNSNLPTMVAPQSQLPPGSTPPGYSIGQMPGMGATQMAPYQPPMMAPPPPAARSGPNVPLIIGLSAAVVVLLILVGVGGFFLFRAETANTPTVTVTGPVPPTITPVAGGATPGASGAATPSVPPRSITATTAAANDPARAQIAAGEAAFQEGQFPQAVAAYKEGLATNPQSAIANRQLGLALWVWNHEPGEVGYLDQATKLDPNDALAWAYLSFSSVDTHQVERAYAAAQRAVAANDREAVAFAAIANAYVRYPPEPANPESGKREARQAIDRAKELDPNNLWVLWSEHIVLSYEEQYEAALVPLDKMIAQRPNWATLYYAKGGLYNALNRPDESRAWQEKSLSIDPDYPYALTELGWLAFDGGDYPQAKRFFERALTLTDDVNDSAHIGLGYTLGQLNDYTNAILHCERAATIESRLPGAFNCLGRLYREGPQRYEDSLAAYREVLELRPYWEDGHVGIALVQADQRQYAAAEATLKQGLPQITKPKYVHYWLGWVLYQQRKYQEAQPNFERAAELVPDDAVVQFQLGQNLEQLQRFPEARATYERALVLNPNYEAARQALDRLTQQGR